MTDIQIKYWDYKEGARHNVVMEGETIRHNVRTEGQTDQQIVESIRHNKEQEIIGHTQASASMIQAAAAKLNSETNKISGLSTASLNEEKATAQHIQNEIAGYGLETKAKLSLVNAASEANNLAMQPYIQGGNMLSNVFKSVKLPKAGTK